MKWTLLYFDDQVQNIECFQELLSEKFHVLGCLEATDYASMLDSCYPHTILLDVHMPIIDGYALHRKIIEHPAYNGCPIIFISGDQSDETKIKSYIEGGVDFLPRNIDIDELVARIGNNIRFFLSMATDLELGNLKLDMKSMKAMLKGSAIDLTLLEMRLLGHLLRAHPHTMTRLDLIRKVWGNETVKPGTINTHLTNLRPKLELWDYVIKVREENILFVKKT